MTRWLNKFQPIGIFLVRIVVGAAMLYHGWPEVVPSSGFHGNHFAALDHFAHYVHALGLPRWLGYVSAFTEVVGGLFLILGLLTRFCAFLVTVNMILALATVDIYKGFSGSEFAIALAAMAFLLLLTGSGAAAIDRRLGLA